LHLFTDFSLGKIKNGNKKALVERKDLVNKSINYLRTIKQKRNEGYSLVYLDNLFHLCLKVLKTNSHPGKKPVLHSACKITNLCPLLRGIFRASEGLGGVH
jgi:hypothetical protein